MTYAFKKKKNAVSFRHRDGKAPKFEVVRNSEYPVQSERQATQRATDIWRFAKDDIDLGTRSIFGELEQSFKEFAKKLSSLDGAKHYRPELLAEINTILTCALKQEDDRELAFETSANAIVLKHGLPAVECMCEIAIEENSISCLLIEYLGRLDHLSSSSSRLEFLKSLLNNEDPALRVTAVLALVHFASALDFDSISQKLNCERNPIVRDAYKGLLKEIEVHHGFMLDSTDREGSSSSLGESL